MSTGRVVVEIEDVFASLKRRKEKNK